MLSCALLQSVFFLLSLLLAQPLAANTQSLDPIVNDEIDVLIDPEHQYTLQDILERPDLNWQQNSKEIPSFGFSPHSYWFRFTISAHHMEGLLEIDYALLDDISFYRLVDGKLADTIFTGDKRPFSERPVQHRAFLFPIPPADQPHQIIIKVRSSSSVQLPITFWPAQTFFEQDQFRFAEHGLYYGIVLVMVLYNLFVFLRLRDKAYAFYVIYVFTFALTQLSITGFAYQFIWPEMPLWNEKSVAILVPLIVVSGIVFTMNFLKLKIYHPRLYKFLWIQIVLGLICSALSILLPYQTMIPFGTGLSIVTCTSILLISYYVTLKSRYKYAVYFSLAWSVFLIGTVVLAMNKFGIIPRTGVTESSAQIGSAIEIILLSFALAERLYDAMQRRFVAEKESVRIKEELIQTQQKQNESLESEVLARTKDLQKALQQVNTLNEELQDLSTLDQVTGVRNRRYFDDMLETEFRRALRNRSCLSLIMLDLDHFKEVNDTHGHQAGDLCLKSVANVMYSIVKRPPDLVCRYGGEELVIILPDTAHEGALLVAERIRRQIEHSQIVFAGRKIPLTASFGVSSFVPNNHKTPASLIELADKALYQAKAAGRNRVFSANKL
jgi:diguanylate cyclase